jgi:guanine deaminase
MMQPKFMQLSIELAIKSIESKGHGPFGAAVIRGEELLGIGTNQVTSTNDPTAHAEINAIRQACKKTNSFALHGCEIYSTCEPCPMCLSAIYWARLDRIYYGATRIDAANANFDDHHFYEEIKKEPQDRLVSMIQIMPTDCLKIFEVWAAFGDKIQY